VTPATSDQIKELQQRVLSTPVSQFCCLGVACPHEINLEDMLDFHDERTHPGFRYGSDSLCRVLEMRSGHSS